MKIVSLMESPWIKVNWNTGNSCLAGMEDPYDGLFLVKGSWGYNASNKVISFEKSNMTYLK